MCAVSRVPSSSPPASASSRDSARWFARAIAAVRVNAVVRTPAGTWDKRRRRGMSLVIAAGNLFLRASRSRIRMFVSTIAWQRWEVAAMFALHRDLRAHSTPRGIELGALPGEPIRTHLARGSATEGMLHAAGRELVRAHRIELPHTGAAFSHGDPHTGNLLFDPSTARAYLIDVETRHAPGLADAERHADDLLVLLLDVAGRAGERWPELARAVLDGYADRAPLGSLADRLVAPRGLERVLWSERTCYLAGAVLDERIGALRAIVDERAAAQRGSSVPIVSSV